LICLGEGGVVVKGSDSQTELAHRMKGGRAAIEYFFDKLWEGSTSSPIPRQLGDLLLGWYFTGDQEPEETFWNRFGTTRRFWEECLALRDSFAAEADSLL